MSRRLAAGIVLALTLTACGGQAVVQGEQYAIFVQGRSLLPRGGEDALIQGTLVTRNGCVLLQQEDTDLASPVLWPAGTSIVSERPLTLALPSGARLAIGETVSGGGGYHDATSERVDVEIPAACLQESDEVAVFNPDAELSLAG